MRNSVEEYLCMICSAFNLKLADADCVCVYSRRVKLEWTIIQKYLMYVLM